MTDTYCEPTTKVTGTVHRGTVRCKSNALTDSTDLNLSFKRDLKASVAAVAEEVNLFIGWIVNHLPGMRNSEWVKHHQKLKEIAKIADGWDGFCAPAPNQLSIRFAGDAIDIIHGIGLAPNAILPSAEGGIGISFSKVNRYASVEFLNDGEIVLLSMIRGFDPVTRLVHFSELKRTFLYVRDFIDSKPAENQ
jgi:hypothetical protein